MNKQGILDYLDFLGRRATELASKKHATEDDLRVVNLEVNRFLGRLRESHRIDEQFMRDVDSLKFPIDEARPASRHWLRYGLIYGLLRFFPGAIVVHFKDKSDSNKRKKELAAFGGQVSQLLDDIDEYDICREV